MDGSLRERTLAAAAARHAARPTAEADGIRRAWLRRNRKMSMAAARAALLGKTAQNPAIPGKITFTVKGIKEAINQPHRAYYAKNRALADLVGIVERATYIGSAKDAKGRGATFHYLKVSIGGIDSVVVVRQQGRMYSVYTISELRKE